jgi:hypothetical protein
LNNLAPSAVTGLRVTSIAATTPSRLPLNITATVDPTLNAFETGTVTVQIHSTVPRDIGEVTVTVTSDDYGVSANLRMFVTVKYELYVTRY